MPAYYNENDPYCAEWLRSLISKNLIAPGDVDARDIRDIKPRELAGYDQCHFFAGIGGWSYALRLAAVPDHRPLWTGSCPCQPFSAAGKRRGFADERHLWPHWFHLISQCRPAIVLGEQVAKATDWLGLVRSDLEGLGYAVGAMPVEAASAGADQLRDRIWFVAHGASITKREPQHANGAESRPDARADISGSVRFDMGSSSSSKGFGVRIAAGNRRRRCTAGKAARLRARRSRRRPG